MRADVLASTVNMSHEEWLAARKNGLGGSDVAVITGFSKYKSPVELYLEKIGEFEPKEAGEAAYFGTLLEDVVAKEFEKRSEMKVRRRNAILRHPDYPWMLANLDRVIVGKQEGFEAKTASAYLSDEWAEDKVPWSYELQCQHYMAVTGYERWWIACLVGGNKFVYKPIERDEEVIQAVIQAERKFWNEHVVKRIPPMIDGSDASSNLLNTLYPKSIPDTYVELPSDAKRLLEDFEYWQTEEKSAGERKDEAANKLKDMLGEHESGWIGERKVIWKSVASNRFDSTKFKKDHPDLYGQYVKESLSRRFSVK
ncbi:YqaJ viral recombinase family protein [Fodinisporobacter ferrooxydans]|uniref:YqaJ viral recombinase family protein n=1 Tax=Fodinisporobacter ferrooxydans TaxID=2901836 RepID=A0ABY4CR41_9BACL|nr:YqaJ viral recombinase family protein [Alicyclobacillaceae bacterium MYW30-H2]